MVVTFTHCHDLKHDLILFQMVCVAMYDYDAADADEVSFREGDKLVYCQQIDAGWMEGTVEKSGQRGMLPSNYVEKVN